MKTRSTRSSASATRKPASRRRDPVTTYARSLVDGKVVAGKPVVQACERHLRDLESGAKRGLKFDPKRAAHAIDFFAKFLRLGEGEHQGKPFKLQPFQMFIVGSLFGWLGADGHRRFRLGYIETAKGNGKSPLAAGIGLYGLIGDKEAGAEIYSAAVTRDQANIVFTDADKMVAASPALQQHIERTAHNLAFTRGGSFFRPVSSEARGLDGKRVHIALIDEIHEHRTALVVDKMRAGTKGRRQPMIVEITNSGYDRTSVCWQHHEYSLRVLDGAVKNDAWFAYVCQLDEKDDWRDEAVWLKANPNLDVSVTWKYLREQVAEAEGMPSKQNIVKRLNFCVWTEQADRWLTTELWMSGSGDGPIDEAELVGRDCFGALDLSSTTDLTAWCKLFPPVGDETRYRAIWRFWITAESLRKRQKRSLAEAELLRQWANAGYVTVTEGNVVDYALMREAINDDGDRFAMKEIAYDPWNATQLAVELEGDGFTCVQFRQGFASMSEPTKKLEEFLLSKKIDHGGNPVAAWMAANVSIAQDPAGNQKPDKATSGDRIDGIVALIMALGRATMSPQRSPSVYETRGVRSFG